MDAFKAVLARDDGFERGVKFLILIPQNSQLPWFYSWEVREARKGYMKCLSSARLSWVDRQKVTN